MKPGELVAARMSGGITIARVVDVESSRVRVAVRRKKEARLPAERILLSTQVFAEGDEQVAEFRKQSEDIASEVDISELWEVVSDEQIAYSFADLADLYWGADVTPTQQVALLLCLDRDALYFEDGKTGYTPRAPDAVEETLARRNRQAQQATEADDLVKDLQSGALPTTLTPHQQMLIDSMRDYAAFGDDYTRSALVKALLNKMERSTGNLQRLAFNVLVNCGEFAPDEPIELVRDDIATEFSDDALAASEIVNEITLLADLDRTDLTALPTFTIDDADTQDRDDALSLEKLPDEDGDAENYRLGIHITDAGALIPRGSVLDEEADRRMASLYTPDRKIPMLPTAVSHDKGSLEAGKRRAALSLLADINADGEIIGFEVKPSVIVSDAALSYDEANSAISTGDHSHHDMLASLHTLTEALKRKREAAGAVGIDRAELLIKVVSPDDVDVKVVQRNSPAREMVAECMVLCNSLLASFCAERDIPASYRSQSAPDLSDLGAGLPPGVEIGEDGPLRQYLMMRRFAPADTRTAPAPHGGLGVPAYIQATSPLRRYPDMVMQRQITHYLSTGEPLYSVEDITSVAGRADMQLRAMGKLEDERRRYWLLKFFKLRMEKAPDDEEIASFQAIVLENQPRRSAMLELTDYPFRVRARLPDAILPGESVVLRLHSVDLWEKRANFIHVLDE
ncbi:MAG: ribonuclease catalytic domain-containing protein [Chloroflexi bacterium]|nr:ribonuclease catalytic domain-containing protein [Chloroflexota bacterium]